MKLPPALLKITRKQWLIVIAVATVLISSLFGYLLAGALTVLGEDEAVPTWLQRSDENSLFAQIAQRKGQIDEQNQIAKRLPEVTATLNGMKAEIEIARKRLPREAQKAEMRQLIEDLARQVGGGSKVQIKSVQIREAAPSGSGRGSQGAEVTTVEYSTQCTTDMDGLIQFINLIERNERFMTVEGISLATGGVTADNSGRKVEYKPHSVTLRIVTYIDRGNAGARK